MRLPLTLQLRVSRRLRLLLAAMHGGALLALVLAVLPAPIKLGLAVALVFSLWLSLRRLAATDRLHTLVLRDDGRVAFPGGDGNGGELSVQAQSTVLPWLVVVLLASPDRRVVLAILPDVLDPDDFRALRLWLRWRAELV